MNPEPTTVPDSDIPSKHLNRVKIAAGVLTVIGTALFGYFVYSVGISELLGGISRFGILGFATLLFIYFFRIVTRAQAWRLSVYEPYKLGLRDTIPAVIIGEAMSNVIPMGILASGTAKAVAVRRRVPIVAGLSSVATENLFYSITTSIFLIFGAVVFSRSYALDEGWLWTIDVLIAAMVFFLVFLVLLIVRQWHFASEICEKLYRRGYATRILENGRLDVRLFENLIYGFYRRYPGRFLPICGFVILYHLLGIVEVWFVLGRISDTAPTLTIAFMLESVSRLITIVFKLVPFVIGIDEAGAQFVGETVGLAVGLGVTLAIIRKARILFWTLIGLLLIVRRGLSVREITKIRQT